MASKKKSAKKTPNLRLVPPPPAKKRMKKKSAAPEPVPAPLAKKEPARQLDFASELVDVDSLKPHPKNYKTHPDTQLRHIEASLKQHGYYKNVVVAQDGTLLAGHGVWEAARRMGQKQIPVRRLKVGANDPAALAVIAGDNEIGRLAVTDDASLAMLLAAVKSSGGDGVDALLGTGYTDDALALLLKGIPEPALPPTEFTEYDINIETEHTCPKCGYEWSGKTSRSRTIASP